MTDLLQQGAAWLAGQRRRHAAHTVGYHRGASSIELLATVGRTLFEQADDYDNVRQIESRDFLVNTTDLVMDGQVAKPQAGDQIRETLGDEVLVYEVMAPGDEPPFKYSPHRHTLRIHTKHVATEDAS